ncbi:sugar ABC transporter ATP-binding protein [Corynebacterium sp. 13CS0277]|uniref:ATP-binding cassette domain-containing protein n=1 Tax=Corynebacterium sp. 13CS0277 TaxID=2071994 RepID=UPI000D03336A|nr:ATP-binding cassette domain-containing protein [Corynebacterium sp. 13CS0277]PRQ11613.1 sugar ABC transporter ATP-binding protein [Corynebacterium sp. 13CS0277]
MTATDTTTATTADATGTPIVELRHVSKSYGHFDALQDINLAIRPGTVTCILGDNGAGKSTLIKVLSGLHEPTSGEVLIDGEVTRLKDPAGALKAGIATVYQDLAVVPTMPVWRNFFLGQELVSPPFGRLKIQKMRSLCREQLTGLGIDIPDIDVQVRHLSGGQRQVVAIARAIFFGARVVILDEPTAALGVKQSGMVLRYVAEARARGIAVVLITHNPHHAHLVGDYFTILKLGQQTLAAPRDEVTLEELTLQMAGGGELDTLSHELGH